MPTSSKSFNDIRNKMLQDPECAALYLEECSAEGDVEFFKLALKNVADAQEGIETL